MKKILLILSIAILPSSFPAQAVDDGNWKQISAVHGKYVLLLNAKALQREGDVINVALRYDFVEQQTFPFLKIKYDRMERRFAFQCKEHLFVALNNNYYLGGNKVHSINLAGGNIFQPKELALVPQKIEPNTMEDEALTHSCNFMTEKK